MKKGVGIIGVIIYSLALLIGYHFALKEFNGKSFPLFSYRVLITKCGPVFYDRIINVEMKIDKLEKEAR